ncbi:MAG: DUF4160 domain-containing protein [Dehalococcoidia bacterium]|nr:DUF4160 domain-containing protein [Dehalococcoidia bacterium]
MPVAAQEGRLRFRINPREDLREPPHVHVWEGNEDVCRIELNGGGFMDEPPPGEAHTILEAYRRHADAIRKIWNEIHGR